MMICSNCKKQNHQLGYYIRQGKTIKPACIPCSVILDTAPQKKAIAPYQPQSHLLNPIKRSDGELIVKINKDLVAVTWEIKTNITK